MLGNGLPDSMAPQTVPKNASIAELPAVSGIQRSTRELGVRPLSSLPRHPTWPVPRSRSPNPSSEFCRKQSPPRYSTNGTVPPTFPLCTVTSVRYDSWPMTYESVSVMTRPVAPTLTTVTTVNGFPALPFPVTGVCDTGVNPPGSLPAGMSLGP